MSHPTSSRPDGNPVIRTEPVQARGTARVAALLDATAAVIAEIGFERLTTAMVAERAGASIGTVYRYFPDRIAVLQSLAARNAEVVEAPVLAAARGPEHADWSAGLAAALARYAEAFATEPGFASIRLGDVIDLRPATGPSALERFAEKLLAALAERFGVAATEAARSALASALVAFDALAALGSRGGESPSVEAGQVAARTLLAPHWS